MYFFINCNNQSNNQIQFVITGLNFLTFVFEIKLLIVLLFIFLQTLNYIFKSGQAENQYIFLC